MGYEGYELDIADTAAIRSSDPKGVFYGTRTMLQLLKQDAEHRHLPRGTTRDYPKYQVRGMMLDVARKFYTIDFLQDYVKLMSWYKMNQFHIHLNDSIGEWGLPFEDGTFWAYRLESETFPGLASPTGYYTKEEFRNLQLLGQDYGVVIVPEIDTPGHSLAFVHYDPSLGTGNNLDITRPETVDFVKALFDEYLDGPNPTFIGPYVHIGTDEYHAVTQAEKEAFRGYMNTLIEHINSKGKHPQFWGGLEEYNGVTPVRTDVIMDVWYEPMQGPVHAIEHGYNIVNVQDNYLYIVPGIRDYLDPAFLYNEWEPNMWASNTLPLGHPNILGGKFALWNDISEHNWITMEDTHNRLFPAVQVLSEKLWTGTRKDKNYSEFLKTAERVGQAPHTNLSHRVDNANQDGRLIELMFENNLEDRSGNGYHGAGHRVSFDKGKLGQGLRFNGSDSYIELPVETLGFGWTVSMWINPDADNPDDAVLMESPHGVLKLNQGSTGKLGFTKGRYDSAFDYTVPSGVWTHILLTGDAETTSLYVNGDEYTETLPLQPSHTFVLPVRTIGGRTNGFKGRLDNVVIYDAMFNRSSAVNYALNKPADSSGAEIPSVGADKAVDGNTSSRWSSDYFLPNPDQAWLSVDLEEPRQINKVTIRWGDAYAEQYKLLYSLDNVNWHNVMPDDAVLNGQPGESVVLFDELTARYIKFQGIRRSPVNGNYFGYVIQELSVYREVDTGDRFAQYRKLVEEAAALLARTGGHPELREALNRLVVNYPYDFERSLSPVQSALNALAASVNQPGTGGPIVISPPDNMEESKLDLPAGQAGVIAWGEEFSFSIPADATDRALVLTATKPQAADAALPYPPLSSIYRIAADKTNVLLRPAVLELQFDPSLLEGGREASIYYYDEADQVWVALGGEAAGNRISIETELLGQYVVLAVKPDDGYEIDLTDIDGHWGEGTIRKAAALGIVAGYDDDTFRPDDTVTRAEFMTMLHRAFRLAANPAAYSFVDSSSIPSWAREAIEHSVAAGIIQGYEDGTFRPSAPVSREAMAVMIANTLKLDGGAGVRQPFADEESIQPWALNAVRSLHEAGLTNGRGNNRFAPRDALTRAEATAILIRALEYGKLLN